MVMILMIAEIKSTSFALPLEHLKWIGASGTERKASAFRKFGATAERKDETKPRRSDELRKIFKGAEVIRALKLRAAAVSQSFQDGFFEKSRVGKERNHLSVEEAAGANRDSNGSNG